MGKLIDLKKQTFGFWTVLESANKTRSGQTTWLCQCYCGVKKVVTTNSLRTGNSTSCGCHNAPSLIGKRFGKLIVNKQDEEKEKGRRFWLCQCDCGKILSVSTTKLRTKKIKSCGNCIIENIKTCSVSHKEKLSEEEERIIGLFLRYLNKFKHESGSV